MKNHKIEIKSEIIDEVANSVSFSSPFLHDKLNELTNEFSISLNQLDLELPQIRNKIVHNGYFPEKINSGGKERELNPIEECKRAIFLLDRIILTLLNYKNQKILNIMDDFKSIKL